MATAIHSDKAKSGQRSEIPTTDVEQSAGKPTTAVASAKLSARKGSLDNSGVGKSLREGAQLLTRAMTNYAARQDPGASADAGSQHTIFLKAYSFLIRAVPKKDRLALLEQMRRGIDEVAKTEMNATLGESRKGTSGEPVSTADFMAGLARQEQEQRSADLASGRLLPGAAIRARLGISAQALSAALKARRIFVMQGPSGEYLYPGFVADGSYDRRVLEKVCKVLGDLPGAAKWDFFMSPRVSLGGKTPLDALAKGKVEEVVSAAGAFREL
ncbi:MAG: hypothetical protein ABWY05_03425 [Noviherbaspirillum sp.]